MSVLTPKPHYFDLTLKGYAVQESSRRRGYFYSSHRDRWDVFDKEGGKVSLSLNYRRTRDECCVEDYRTLFGFEYHTESGLLKCGLEQVILTAEHNCSGMQARVVDAPPWKKYELDFLSDIADAILQNPVLIAESLPVKKEKRHYREFNLWGFPKEFVESFMRAIPYQSAYSIPYLKISVEMEKLGLKPSLGKQMVWGILPEAAGKGFSRSSHRSSGQ
ncbi:hypothetical protein HZC30_00835 [Candidatus Woesearchaeota archaeon]|nr:hypothetical protein [Candidatus Woesearchaeota archaeon]